MSYRKTTVLSCDHPGCATQLEAVNATQVRYEAKTAGWLIKTEDLCPQHRPDTRAARIARKPSRNRSRNP